MWKLTIEDDQGNRIPVPLVRDDYSIGRAAENTLRLTERNVSRKHASLRQDGGRWFLLDLDSYNGCYVNGERVSEQRELADGDLIQLADYRIEILEEADAKVMVAEPAPVEQVVPAKAPSFPQEIAEAEGQAPMYGVESASEALPPSPALFNAQAHEDLDEIPGIPKRRSSLGGVALLGAAALALSGVGFAWLRSETPAPAKAAAVALAEVAPANPNPEPESEQAPAEELEIELARAEVAEPESIDIEELPEAKPTAPTAPAEARPAAALARAPIAKTDERPRTAAAAPPKSQAGGDRRPVLAANPFDSSKAGASTSTKAPSGGNSLTGLAAQGSEGEAKMRPILEQRIASGKASTNDIKLLRAICRNMGDKVCADRMTALLAQQK